MSIVCLHSLALNWPRAETQLILKSFWQSVVPDLLELHSLWSFGFIYYIPFPFCCWFASILCRFGSHCQSEFNCLNYALNVASFQQLPTQLRPKSSQGQARQYPFSLGSAMGWRWSEKPKTSWWQGNIIEAIFTSFRGTQNEARRRPNNQVTY